MLDRGAQHKNEHPENGAYGTNVNEGSKMGPFSHFFFFPGGESGLLSEGGVGHSEVWKGQIFVED